MVQVDYNSLREGDCTIDLESGTNAVINEEVAKLGNKYSNSVEASLENVEAVADKRFGGGEVSPPLQKKAAEGKKPKKKSSKKPPKPPRPPRAPSMDTADQIIAREMHEIAVMKRERARAERMKALKSMKNSKSASSSTNLFGLVITIIFCLVIIWQGKQCLQFCSNDLTDLFYYLSVVMFTTSDVLMTRFTISIV